jgi:serine/threonine protein kinase
MTPAHPTAHVLAGYRLVRKLGAGTRSEAFLGVAGVDAPPGDSDPAAPRSAVLKVFRDHVPPADAGSELEALTRVDSVHCVRLIDVASAADGLPIAILGRVHKGSMVQLLRFRQSIEPGEAVTLLAPLTSAMTDLHRSGVAHGNISLSSVHLGAAGEPVLLGFGHVKLFEAGMSVAALDNEASVVADRQLLAALAGVVLGHLRSASPVPAVRDLIDWLRDESSVRRFEFADELEGRLFDLADPLPVEVNPGLPTRVTVPPRTPVVGPAQAELLQAASSGSVSVLDVVEEVVMSNPARAVRRRLSKALRGVRTPLWIVTGAVAIGLAAAIAFVPQASTSTSTALARSSPSPVALPRRSAVPEDPVVASSALLSRRLECFRERSVSCLDAVDGHDSAALDDDQHAIRAIQAGGEPADHHSEVAHAPVLVQRLGDSALITLDPESGPASVLLVKEEAGWRIRSFQSGETVQR